MKSLDALHATSRVSVMRKCQVRVPVPGAAVRSAGPRTVSVASLTAAWSRRWRSAALNTSPGFCNAPDPAIVMPAGSVTQ